LKIPLEDRLEMMDTLAKYAWCCDNGDTDELMELFTPDGVLEAVIPGTTEPYAPSGHVKRFEGREALRKFVGGTAPEVFGRPGSRQLHLQSNFLIEEISETKAKTRNYMIWSIQLSAPDVRDDLGPAMLSHGYYLDEWEKYEGRWRFKLRSYRPAGYHPLYHDEHAKSA
jgi:hypothetical protein